MEALNDVVGLTSKLVSINSINPPGRESECSEFLGNFLESYGFSVEIHHFGEHRTNLIAKLDSPSHRKPICFTGHLDTVPLGGAPWTKDPFVTSVENNCLFGRGTTDMKGGVAAFCLAAIELRDLIATETGISLVITGGEETGCEGALALKSRPDLLTEVGAIIVGEPTSNYPIFGHKGALWLRGVCNGITAHGSSPELGDNAIHKACTAVGRLQAFNFNLLNHNIFGIPTLNVGRITGGLNTNSVPDYAAFELDIRSVPNQQHTDIIKAIVGATDSEIQYETIVDLPGVMSDPSSSFSINVGKIVGLSENDLAAIPIAKFFTDASVLTPTLGNPPTIILGPGDIEMAHKTDEYCRIDALFNAVDIYKKIIIDWCKTKP